MANVEELVARRQGDWAELEALLRRAAGGGLRRFSGPELERLGQLYRQTSGDLAIAQRDFPHDRVRLYLDQLLARAHPYLYQGQVADWSSLLRFFAVGYPRLFRANAPYVLASAALFFGPALVAYLASLLSPAAQQALVSAPMLETIQRGEMWTNIPESVRPVASTGLMTNNVRVAILAFAGGILAGTLTAYVLLQNGLMLGSVFGTCQAHGLGLPLLAFVSAHGYLELSAIVVSGAAGFRLGLPILRPGLLPRRLAVAQGARAAVLLLLGAVPWLGLAGILEAFVSPSDLPAALKIAVGPLTALALYAYLLLAGRERQRRDRLGGHTLARPPAIPA